MTSTGATLAQISTPITGRQLQGYRALDQLRSEGVVKAIGIGVNEADIAAEFMAETDLDLIMLAGRYT